MHYFYFNRSDLRMINSLFHMNLADRFLGSSLGLVWAILAPLLLMSIFVFVFTYVFPGRLPGREGTLPFIIWLLSGYAPWLGLSEGLGSSTNSVVSNAGVVKNIAFKSEILPIVGAMMGIVPLSVGLAVIFLLQIVGGEPINSAVLILPFVIFLLLIFVSGIGLFLSSLNVFVRDTAIALPSILTAILFSSPIFYALSSYPEPIRRFLVFNPFYILTECFRDPILRGTLPPLWMIVYMIVVSIALFIGGLWWFRRLKSFFDTRL